jgi:hypothetical protein
MDPFRAGNLRGRSMRLTAISNTEDNGRITIGKVYHGSPQHWDESFEPRVLIFDDKREWTVFALKDFVPLGEYLHEGVPRSGAQ